MSIFKEFIGSKEKVLSDLIFALKEIDANFIEQNYTRINSKIQRSERYFTAELYHQLRRQQEKKDDYKNLNYQIETVKNRYNNPQINNCLNLTDFKRISPDLILHKSQNDKQRGNQQLVCEIKMKGANSEKIKKDYQKLLYYKLSELNFKNSIFIYTGSIKKLNKILKNEECLLNCIQRNNIITITLEKGLLNNRLNWKIFTINIIETK